MYYTWLCENVIPWVMPSSSAAKVASKSCECITYVCIYIYIYTYIYIYIHTHTLYIYIERERDIYIYIHTHICIYISMVAPWVWLPPVEELCQEQLASFWLRLRVCHLRSRRLTSLSYCVWYCLLVYGRCFLVWFIVCVSGHDFAELSCFWVIVFWSWLLLWPSLKLKVLFCVGLAALSHRWNGNPRPQPKNI